jgi:hypothetical protein
LTSGSCSQNDGKLFCLVAFIAMQEEMSLRWIKHFRGGY